MEKIPSVKNEKLQLNKLMNKEREGDTICVVPLDGLDRRMIKLVQLINDFRNKGIEFIALENSTDTTTPVEMVLFSMCAAFSEIERESIRERVKAGFDAAHKKGRKGGRPKSLTSQNLETLLSLKKSGEFSVKEIFTMEGVTRSVYYRAIG